MMPTWSRLLASPALATLVVAACTSTAETGDDTDVDAGTDTAPPDDAPTTPVFATCGELHAADPQAADGAYTLHVGGDRAKPWTAYCADMRTASPVEYLSLVNILGDANRGMYAAGGSVAGSDVITHYVRVRIDPTTLVVATSDQRFATSTGTLFHGEEAVTAMPFGTAMACNEGGVFGHATIDLRGTPFVLGEAFQVWGDGAITIAPDRRTADLAGGGQCGWTGPTDTPFNPYNARGGTIALSYVAE